MEDYRNLQYTSSYEYLSKAPPYDENFDDPACFSCMLRKVIILSLPIFVFFIFLQTFKIYTREDEDSFLPENHLIQSLMDSFVGTYYSISDWYDSI